jgi:hypothetical protein
MTIDAVQDRYTAILNESLMLSEKRLSGMLLLLLFRRTLRRHDRKGSEN